MWGCVHTRVGGWRESTPLTPTPPAQHCTCVDDCSSSNCLCGQLSIRCWYDKVRAPHLATPARSQDPALLGKRLRE